MPPLPSARAVEYASYIQGWMRPAELAWLHWQAGRIPKGGTWVEIGSWKGRSTVATALGLPEGALLVSVENFAGNAGSGVQPDLGLPVPWVKWNLEIAFRMIRELRPDVRWDARETSSAEAARSPYCADAVFIDGEHTYEAAKADILAWRPRLKKGGLLCGHDREAKGVKRALAELVPDHEKAKGGSIWWRVEK
jgi:predicted O-methyltransferase YrrM